MLIIQIHHSGEKTFPRRGKEGGLVDAHDYVQIWNNDWPKNSGELI
jgi:hypothetical protein